MQASVLIPTFARSDKLANCLACLAKQDFDHSQFEVIVGFDGPDPGAEDAAREKWKSCGGRAPLELMQCPREGLMMVRNRMLKRARGTFMISINDDVRPVPGFVGAHIGAHRTRAKPIVAVGASPFCRRENESLLDLLTRKTSMIFFYDTMDAAPFDPERDWGFRHCFGLNFSARTELVRAVGGFYAGERLYGYEDIELGFRLAQEHATPVLYRPDARADHEHFYRPQDLLTREHNLGVAAWHFARANPSFAKACFGRDVSLSEEVEYSQAFVTRERVGVERIRDSFLRYSDIPATAVEGAYEALLLQALLQQFLLLKRWTWRSGLLAAAGAEVSMAA
ncbi:MAG: glycosyltransferase [Phycisphaeraceae bacterium]|nr:glycosyltransferase [Phycisphaeraceae bacterium]